MQTLVLSENFLRFHLQDKHNASFNKLRLANQSIAKILKKVLSLQKLKTKKLGIFIKFILNDNSRRAYGMLYRNTLIKNNMSYTTSYYHVVFRTYRSEPTINEEHEQELYGYIIGIAQNLHCVMYRIGGMPEHIHMFVSLPSSLSLAEFVQRVKTESSKWLKANKNFPGFAGWGHEYAGFSYSIRDKDMIINYIKNQKEHHKKTKFSNEYRSFIKKNGVTVDERYFLHD